MGRGCSNRCGRRNDYVASAYDNVIEDSFNRIYADDIVTILARIEAQIQAQAQLQAQLQAQIQAQAQNQSQTDTDTVTNTMTLLTINLPAAVAPTP